MVSHSWHQKERQLNLEVSVIFGRLSRTILIYSQTPSEQSPHGTLCAFEIQCLMMSNSGVGVGEAEEGIGRYYTALQQEEVQTHAAGFTAKLHFILSLRWDNYQLPQSGRRRHSALMKPFICYSNFYYFQMVA